MNADPIKPVIIVTLPNVPRTRVVHMARTLLSECKGSPAEELRAAIVLRTGAEPLVLLREDLENEETQ